MNKDKCRQTRTQTGFTLIELVVTVMIIAILSAIAIPNYASYVSKSKAASGQQAIAAVMSTLEQTYLDTRAYPAAQTITDNNHYFTYTYTQSGSPAGLGFYITAQGNAALNQYYLAANSFDVRCACLACGNNPLSGFNDAALVCPAGSTAW